jgi:hypothetical protein
VARLGQEATWYYQSQEGNHEQAKIVISGSYHLENHIRISGLSIGRSISVGTSGDSIR